MNYTKNENSLTAQNTAVQTTLVHDTDKGNHQSGLSIEQLNEYLVQRSGAICEYVRKKRTGRHTSDIIPPLCYKENTLNQNIDSVLACFSSTLSVALSSETRYIQALQNFEALSSIVESEKDFIFEFLSENGLIQKFNEFVNLKKQVYD